MQQPPAHSWHVAYVVQTGLEAARVLLPTFASQTFNHYQHTLDISHVVPTPATAAHPGYFCYPGYCCPPLSLLL
jgi:hypothetical protein